MRLLAKRSVIRVSGPDAPTFLNNLLTQDLSAPDGGARFAALLTPQGKILFDAIVVPTGDGFFLDIAGAALEAAVRRLSLYRLRARVAVDAAPDLAVYWGDGADAFDDPRLAALGRRAIRPIEPAPAGDEAWDAQRIALGVPAFGEDFGPEEVFLLDVNYDALGGVSYKKGCFIGQEVTSRMKRKGEVRRRTLIARFEGIAPAKDTPILSADAPIGEIASSAGAIALAFVRLDRWRAQVAAGAPITADGRILQLEIPSYLEPEYEAGPTS